MGIQIMVDTHPDGESFVRLLKGSTCRDIGSFRNMKMLSAEVCTVALHHTQTFITPEDKIIFSQVDDDGDIVETKTVELEAFITKYKGRVDNLAIRPNKPVSQPTAADMLKDEEATIKGMIDLSLDMGDKVLFTEYSDRLQEFRKMMGEK